MTISFIIVNYKSERYLKKCIASIFNKIKKVDFEIIIINNDSDKFADFENEDIGVVEINENIGFGKACNIGAKKARGRLLCFLNPDAEIISENIIEIVRKFEKDKKTGIIGPRILTPDEKIQAWSAGVDAGLWDILRNNLGLPKSRKIWESFEKIEADWVSGACFFIRKKIFQELGGFDKNFFLYFEDMDLCRRTREVGYKVLYFPDFNVRHQGGKSSARKEKQKEAYYQSQDYYFKKHFGKISATILRVLRRIFI